MTIHRGAECDRLIELMKLQVRPAPIHHAAAAALAGPARVWVLASPRAGERTQLIALADALGLPYEVKRVVHHRLGQLPGLLGHEGLAGVDLARSDALAGPWPELVLLAHHKNEAVARWIKRQSGGRTRLVLLGRSWAPAELFDLVVTTPQYRLPEAENVLLNALPLHPVAPGRLAQAAAEWRPRVAHLPKPYITVLVGGSSGPYKLDAAAAARLGREVSALARELGGSVLVTTSARTPAESVEALFAAIDAPAYLHGWSPHGGANPYLGFIGLAERLVVTADSISMIAEACASGRPVQLFDFGPGGPIAMREDRAATTAEPLGRRIGAWLYAGLLKLPRGRLNRTRDLRVVHRALLAAGRVSWLGEPVARTQVRLAGNEMTRTLNRVRDLLRGREPERALAPRLPVRQGMGDAAMIGLGAAAG